MRPRERFRSSQPSRAGNVPRTGPVPGASRCTARGCPPESKPMSSVWLTTASRSRRTACPWANTLTRLGPARMPSPAAEFFRRRFLSCRFDAPWTRSLNDCSRCHPSGARRSKTIPKGRSVGATLTKRALDVCVQQIQPHRPLPQARRRRSRAHSQSRHVPARPDEASRRDAPQSLASAKSRCKHAAWPAAHAAGWLRTPHPAPPALGPPPGRGLGSYSPA